MCQWVGLTVYVFVCNMCMYLVTFVFVKAYVRQFSSCRFKVGIKVSPYFKVDCLLRSLFGLLGHHLYSILVSKSINLQSNLPLVTTQNAKTEWSLTRGGHLQESNPGPGGLFQEELCGKLFIASNV